MAKRFTDTRIWNREWFRVLSPRQKELWRYLCDNCDGFGTWEIDWGTASHFIGDSVGVEDIAAFQGRVIQVASDKLWVPRWLTFHYKKFNPENKVHRAVMGKVIAFTETLTLEGEALAIVEQFKNLLSRVPPNQPLGNPYLTPNQGLQEKGIRNKEKGKVLEGGAGETKHLRATELVALWNKFSEKLPACTEITYLRGSAITQRLREHPDLAWWETAISRIAASPFCTGKTKAKWKASFDWLLSGDNALKAFEGQYDAEPDAEKTGLASSEQRVKCDACTSGLIRAVNRFNGQKEWCSCFCDSGRARTTYPRFDENRFERVGAA